MGQLMCIIEVFMATFFYMCEKYYFYSSLCINLYVRQLMYNFITNYAFMSTFLHIWHFYFYDNLYIYNYEFDTFYYFICMIFCICDNICIWHILFVVTYVCNRLCFCGNFIFVIIYKYFLWQILSYMCSNLYFIYVATHVYETFYYYGNLCA